MHHLPPGQVGRGDFPRFGLTRYAARFPARPGDRSLQLRVPAGDTVVLADALKGLPRLEVKADFHCVTTWSALGLTWGGVRFSDFFDEKVRPLVPSLERPITVVMRAQDGYRTSLPLDDLLADDVMLADALDGRPLSIAHGAPVRVVAPAHYGYKSLKHLSRLEFRYAPPVTRRGLFAFVDHPRARVHLEERGRWFPGWLLRRIYRPLIARTARTFQDAMREHDKLAAETA